MMANIDILIKLWLLCCILAFDLFSDSVPKRESDEKDRLHTKELRILTVGNSITRGSYLRKYTNGAFVGSAIGLPNPDGGGYRKPLQDKLREAGVRFNFVGDLTYGAYGNGGVVDADFDPDHHGLAGFGNEAILNGGEVPTPPDVLAALGIPKIVVHGITKVLERHKPNVILLMSGSNCYNAAARDQLIQMICDNSDAHLFVATIPPQAAPRKGWEKVDDYNDSLFGIVALKKKEGKRITLVDVNAAFTEEDLLPDGVHPNKVGMEKIALAWFEVLMITPEVMY